MREPPKAPDVSGTLVAVGVLQTLIYLVFIRSIDLYEREPLRYVIPVFIWGFSVAVVLSLVFNALFAFTLTSVAGAGIADFLTVVVGAPVIEESSKGLALLIVFAVSYYFARRRGAIEFSGVMDGIVYGSAVGFGFSIAEDIFYYAQFGSETFVVRRIFGGFAHAAFTALIGIGIGLIPWVRSMFLKISLPILGLLGAMLLHAVFNFLATLFGVVAYVFLFLVVLAYIVLIVVWLSVERRAIREELREEVASGLISAEEHAVLPTYFRRKGRYIGHIFSGRISVWLAERKSHNAAVDLALAKRASRGRWTNSQAERIHALRARISARKPSATRSAN
ncbi:MAG: PrsW family intramembrane metalloprotease [Actinomycetota bacterium]|jgi:RsiW-degrading membrane proteinase PrsW (M82 family)|nr:PrsW family intramembrane metalloprotease [Rubrobacter sp.]MDQ3509169.1 PrsW family intramembrane metalloprotease [Actinomycetota bacterium]